MFPNYLSFLLVFIPSVIPPLAWGMAYSLPCNVILLVINLGFFDLKCFISSSVLKDVFTDHRILSDIFFFFHHFKGTVNLYWDCFEFWPSFLLMRSQSSFFIIFLFVLYVVLLHLIPWFSLDLCFYLL